MRMWMIDPELLCNKHLIGEHGEIHKHHHNFVKQHNISGRIFPIVQIEPSSMKSRHDQLTAAMEKRFNKTYNSPYNQPDISYLPMHLALAKVDIQNSLTELASRCPDCANRINNII